MMAFAGSHPSRLPACGRQITGLSASSSSPAVRKNCSLKWKKSWGKIMAFRSKLKIRFGDIDRAGIVYYPRFMHYFHVALEEFFAAELGIEYHTVVDTHRIGLPTVHLE
jgi:hypothetical protein